MWSVRECVGCKYKTPSLEKFTCLAIDIASVSEASVPVELRTCIEEPWKTEYVGDRLCSECGHRGAYKSTRIESVPRVLILQLKRFQLTETGYIKNQALVKVPLCFKLKEHDYNVIGIVNHVGSTMNSGHYTADIKVENWKHCNDRRITNIRTVEEDSSEVYLVFSLKSPQ